MPYNAAARRARGDGKQPTTILIFNYLCIVSMDPNKRRRHYLLFVCVCVCVCVTEKGEGSCPFSWRWSVTAAGWAAAQRQSGVGWEKQSTVHKSSTGRDGPSCRGKLTDVLCTCICVMMLGPSVPLKIQNSEHALGVWFGWSFTHAIINFALRDLIIIIVLLQFNSNSR